MTPPNRRPTMIVIRGPGYPPAGPNGTPLSYLPPDVMRKYASSKPLFRPKPRRLPKHPKDPPPAP
jgi:hypothetical protein